MASPQCLFIGNSRWHWAEQTESNQWVFQHAAPAPECLDSPTRLLAWAAVGPVPDHPCLQFSRRLDLQEVPLLGVPPWLGIDRALAGWAAWRASASRLGVMVVDAGTVLSLTRVSGNGWFSGGLLAAGFGLQLRAMGFAAEGLEAVSPLALNSEMVKSFPLETHAAMHAGALKSLVGLVQQAHSQCSWPIWLCGGDAPQLLPVIQQQLGVEVCHAPDLVMQAMIDLISDA